MQGFKSRSSAQHFLETHAAVYNTFKRAAASLDPRSVACTSCTLGICLGQGGSVIAERASKVEQTRLQLG